MGRIGATPLFPPQSPWAGLSLDSFPVVTRFDHKMRYVVRKQGAYLRQGGSLQSAKVCTLAGGTRVLCDKSWPLDASTTRVHVLEPAVGWVSLKCLRDGRMHGLARGHRRELELGPDLLLDEVAAEVRQRRRLEAVAVGRRALRRVVAVGGPDREADLPVGELLRGHGFVPPAALAPRGLAPHARLELRERAGLLHGLAGAQRPDDILLRLVHRNLPGVLHRACSRGMAVEWLPRGRSLKPAVGEILTSVDLNIL